MSKFVYLALQKYDLGKSGFQIASCCALFKSLIGEKSEYPTASVLLLLLQRPFFHFLPAAPFLEDTSASTYVLDLKPRVLAAANAKKIAEARNGTVLPKLSYRKALSEGATVHASIIMASFTPV